MRLKQISLIISVLKKEICFTIKSIHAGDALYTLCVCYNV